MEEIVFHHTLPIQLRFNDVDKFGHVNNTVYFSFYDLGKTEYFASVCPGVDWEKTGIVVVHIEADFVKQIFASDHIAVQTAVSEVGTKSFHLLQRVIDLGIAAIFAGFFLSCVRTRLCFGIFSRLWIYTYHKAGVQTHKCQNGDRSK